MADFRPIPGDEQYPMVMDAMARIGTEHLLANSIGTFAAEAMQHDGTHHQWTVIIEFEGRFNRTDETGAQKVVLDYEAAMVLLKNLHHSLVALTAAGGGPTNVAEQDEVTHELTLEHDADGWDVATCECGWTGPPCPGPDLAAEFYSDHRAGA